MEMYDDDLMEIKGPIPDKQFYKGPSEYALLRGKKNEVNDDWRNNPDEKHVEKIKAKEKVNAFGEVDAKSELAGNVEIIPKDLDVSEPR